MILPPPPKKSSLSALCQLFFLLLGQMAPSPSSPKKSLKFRILQHDLLHLAGERKEGREQKSPLFCDRRSSGKKSFSHVKEYKKTPTDFFPFLTSPFKKWSSPLFVNLLTREKNMRESFYVKKRKEFSLLLSMVFRFSLFPLTQAPS